MRKNILFTILLILVCCFIVVDVNAGPASAGKIIFAIRKAPTLIKSGNKADNIIDGAKAIKQGKKLYSSADFANDSVKIGKGMLGKLSDCVPENVIDECADIVKSGKQGNLGDVGQILNKMFNNPNLSQRQRELMLSDAYLRIAKKAGKLSDTEADEVFQLLNHVEGLSTQIRKICSPNVNQSAGHLYELKQALAFRKNGFEVLGICLKYDDGIKSAATDLDLLVQKGNKVFLIESKHYTSTWSTASDVIRADADSLLNLQASLHSELDKSIDVVPIFTFVQEPTKLLAMQLENKGIRYLVGEGEKVVEILSAMY